FRFGEPGCTTAGGPAQIRGRRLQPIRHLRTSFGHEGRMIAAVGRAAANEGGRLGDLYRRHAGDAERLAYLLTGDRGAAEALVQDAFVRLAGRLMHLRDPDAFGAYLR